MFATFFVQEFGLTKFGERLGPTAQFINFQNAMITCYQMVTEVKFRKFCNFFINLNLSFFLFL